MKKLLFAALLVIASAANAATTGPVEWFGFYPPSCLAWPVLEAPSGPTYSRSTLLASLDRATMLSSGYESVDFTFWRVPCNGGRSALLLRISRAVGSDSGKVVQFPMALGLGVRQGTKTGLLRLTKEPNSVESHLDPGALIPREVVVVVDFYRSFTNVIISGAYIPGVSVADGEFAVDLNQALEITLPIAPGIGISPIAPPLVIPAYDPSQYVASPLPITGYNAGSYFDPAHPGEGMIVDIAGGYASDFGQSLRAVTIAWFTYDQGGRPFWLHGTGFFTPGTKEVVVSMGYYANGGFAGAATASRQPWGTVKVSFPDCSAMKFSFAGNSNLTAPVPSGSGDRTWARLTQQNGLRCG